MTSSFFGQQSPQPGVPSTPLNLLPPSKPDPFAASDALFSNKPTNGLSKSGPLSGTPIELNGLNQSLFEKVIKGAETILPYVGVSHPSFPLLDFLKGGLNVNDATGLAVVGPSGMFVQNHAGTGFKVGPNGFGGQIQINPKSSVGANYQNSFLGPQFDGSGQLQVTPNLSVNLRVTKVPSDKSAFLGFRYNYDGEPPNNQPLNPNGAPFPPIENTNNPNNEQTAPLSAAEPLSPAQAFAEEYINKLNENRPQDISPTTYWTQR